MRSVVLLVAALVVSMAGLGETVSPIQQEFLTLVEQAKSEDAAKRAEAVAEIVSLRALVAKSLMNTVAIAEEGQAEVGSMVSSFFLMGRMGLPEAKEILAANRERWLDDRDIHDVSHRTRPLIGPVGEWSWGSAGFADTFVVSSAASAAQTSLSKYPVLEGALANLLSPERPMRHQAEDVVLEWYTMLARSFASVLNPRDAELYSKDVRVAAAFLLGELRANDDLGAKSTQEVLIENAGLQDQTDTRDRYTESLTPIGGRSEYPCIDALLKIGGRVHVDLAVAQIVDESAHIGKLTEADRRRVGEALVVIDAERVRATLDRRREWLTNLTSDDLPKQGIEASERDKLLETLAELSAVLPQSKIINRDSNH